jgi:hypothetical protein
MDRTPYLEQFRNAGIVTSPQELNAMGQEEFEAIVDALSIREAPAPQGDDASGTVLDLTPLPEMSIQERIAALRVTKNAVAVEGHLELGRSIARELLDGYNTRSRPQILSSRLASLRIG